MIRKMMAMYDAEAQSKTCGCRRHVIVPPTMLTIKALPIDSAAATTHRKRLLVVDPMASCSPPPLQRGRVVALAQFDSGGLVFPHAQIDNCPEICNCLARVNPVSSS